MRLVKSRLTVHKSTKSSHLTTFKKALFQTIGMNKKHFLAALGVICLPVQLLSYFELSSILSLAGNAKKARAGG